MYGFQSATRTPLGLSVSFGHLAHSDMVPSSWIQVLLVGLFDPQFIALSTSKVKGTDESLYHPVGTPVVNLNQHYRLMVEDTRVHE